MKQCSSCKKNKNFDKFYKRSASIDGHSAYCKECSNEYSRKKRGSKKRYNKSSFVSETHKECTQCKEIKPLELFAKNSSSSSGRHSWCKKCMAEKVLDYRGGRVFKKLKKTESHKQCRVCEQIKPYSDFSKKDKKNAQKESYCFDCKKFMGTERVLSRYGLNVDSYMEMFNSQNGVCLICKKPEKNGRRLSVDHDHSCCNGAHSCGKCIRGLLCSRCNKTLGMVEDNIEYLNAMIKYLKFF